MLFAITSWNSTWTRAVTLVVLGLLVLCHAIVEGRNTSFSYPSLGDLSLLQTEGGIVESGDSGYDRFFSEYTLNSAAYKFGFNPEIDSLDGSCGRILYADKVRMMDTGSSRVASFNAAFTFRFLQANATFCGSGMAFTFTASNEPNFFDVGEGWGMCAFEYSLSTNDSKPVFAVKFDSYLSVVNDTVPDPSNSNIGVVITDKQGKTSVTQHNLCDNNVTQCNIFCNPNNSDSFTAWIDYDSATGSLEVRFEVGEIYEYPDEYDTDETITPRSNKPEDAVITVSNLRLDEVLTQEDMYVGFSASTSAEPRSTNEKSWGEAHVIQAWEFNSSEIPDPSISTPPVASPVLSPSETLSRKSLSAGVVAGICAAVLAAFFMGVCFLFCINRSRSKSSSDELHQSPLILTDTPRVFKFSEVRRITKNFSDCELLSGGYTFGDVFERTLPGTSGTLVAVKRVKGNERDLHGQEASDEGNLLEKIHNFDLLQLRGWCQGNEGVLLVYD